MRKIRAGLIGVVLTAMLLSGCETLRDVADGMRKPQLRIASTELEALSFSGLTLVFNVEIRNPNPIGISLAGFDYELQIEDNPFVSGEVEETIAIAARGSSTVPLPVELSFEEVVESIGDLKGKEEAAYQLASGFTFDLPVLGKLRVPLETSGSLPILRIPELQVVSLRLNEISLSGANLDLELELSNPNSFKVFVQSLEYHFQVEGQDWVSGMRQERVRLAEKERALLTIPIELDFAALGRGVQQLILGRQRLQYILAMNVEVGTSLRALQKTTLPFELTGELRVRR